MKEELPNNFKNELELENKLYITPVLRAYIPEDMFQTKISQFANLALRSGNKMQLSRTYNTGGQKTNFKWNAVAGTETRDISIYLNFTHGDTSGRPVACSSPTNLYVPVEGYYTMRVKSYWTYGGWSPSQYNNTTSTNLFEVNGQTFSQTKHLDLMGYWYASVTFDFTFTAYLNAGNNVIKDSWIAADHNTLPNGHFNFPFGSNINGSITIQPNYTIYQSQNNSAYQKVLTTQRISEDLRTPDVNAPNIPTTDLIAIRGNKELITLKAFSKDNATGYKHYITSDIKTTEQSDPVETTVISGVKGFSYVIDKKTNTIPDDTIEFNCNGGITEQVEGRTLIKQEYINKG